MIERLWGSPSPVARLARAFLVPCSVVFGGTVAVRNMLYDRGWLAAHRVAVPVVSVGNVRVGGTGKTPFVMWLVERLQQRGLRPAVVARGYGADPALNLICRSSEATALPNDLASVRVTTTDGVPDTVVETADEALLVALRTGAAVVTGADRHAACVAAVRAFAPDVIVLDDGFQHRRLARDVDVVLLASGDATARLLPAGPLREGVASLHRAHVVVARDPGAQRYATRRRAAGLVRAVARDAAVDPPTALQGVAVAAVAGIASNDEFYDMLRSLGAKLTREISFPDHHRYRPADWEHIVEAAEGARWIVTTEKDLVKLAAFGAHDARLRALRLALDVDGAEEIVALICARARLDASPRGQHDPPPRPPGVEA